MKKIIVIVLLAAVLLFAYFTKPTDKNCKIMVVKAVWGNVMPNEYQSPRFFAEFMDLYAKDITIDDWGVFKIIKYQMPNKKLVSIGAFKKIFFIKT
jgi:hypothetical protein